MQSATQWGTSFKSSANLANLRRLSASPLPQNAYLLSPPATLAMLGWYGDHFLVFSQRLCRSSNHLLPSNPSFAARHALQEGWVHLSEHIFVRMESAEHGGPSAEISVDPGTRLNSKGRSRCHFGQRFTGWSGPAVTFSFLPRSILNETHPRLYRP